MSIRVLTAAFASIFIVGCSSSAPFSYASDRCTGQHNACQTDCTSLDDGPARAACMQRCYAVENTCRSSGYDGSGSSLAVNSGVGAARTREEKEAAYEAWRAKRQREQLESGESDVDIEVIEDEKK
ncbi:hypothetical protein ACFOOP_17465 [Marinicaulis aureus]|uniref:Lipoprotein n=1 Tax=Hyphococcus aureus TaxID=2666033 RepID=A0ABW1KW42_9PROT